MDFPEDLFRRRPGHGHHYDSHHFGSDLVHFALNRLVRNKTLLAILAGIVLLIFITAIALVVVLLLLFSKGIVYISQNGIKGVFDFILPLINRLWAGGGKASIPLQTHWKP
jgi:hypothetical protein